MKKISLSFLIALLSCITTNAQKELWGVNSGQVYINPDIPGYFGNITKYDINGENPAIMHEFDSINGYNPIGKLFLASNGKLYGTTKLGGIAGPQGSFATGGVLFEYDLVLNKYTILHYFDLNSMSESYNPYIGVIEPIPGMLYGATANRIYKYDLATENVTFFQSVPFNNIYSELMIASNGFIYGTSYLGNCNNTGSNEPYQGTIFKYSLATNVLTTVFTFSCSNANGFGSFPNSKLLEISPGKLIGTAYNGGVYMGTNPGTSGGTLYEFDTNTNVFNKKTDFNYYVNGVHPNNLVQDDNRKLYGLCEEGGVPSGNTSTNPTDFRGTLYEYTPETNTIVVKQYFGTTPGNFVMYPTSLMKTSNGYFMGTVPNGGLFKFDAVTNTIITPNSAGAGDNTYNNANLIEICRKPSYHFFDVDTFDGCVGSTFTYDVQNINAATYQWLKDGDNVPNQTTGILNLTNLAASDAGNYTCLMTNECGMTTTMVLHLTINCLGTDTFAYLDQSIKLYPNPTKDILNVKLPENITVIINNIKIANSLGQVVREQKIQNNTIIDVSQLKTGIYFISLITNYGVWNGKFIKE